MFTRKEVDEIVKQLDGQIFVSEAHLQVAFALKIDKERFEVYPEFPATVDNERSEFDLLIRERDTNENTLIEFKYKTANRKKDSVTFTISSGVDVELKNHGAQDTGWYDSWKDIHRIEQCVLDNADVTISNGFFILITNDSKYWSQTDGRATENLYMNEGHHEHGEKRFNNERDYRGKKRQNGVSIERDYDFKYTPYKCFSEIEQYGEFKMLIVEIEETVK